MSANRLSSIYRHLVKGFNQETLLSAELAKGGTLLGDRSFAFQYMDTELAASAENAPWISKMSLAVQHDWPDLAQITPSWNPDSHALKLEIKSLNKSIECRVSENSEREKLASFVHEFMQIIQPYEKARHPNPSPLRLIGNASFSTRYTDGEKGPISLAFKESILDLENKYGFKVDERRFRLNFFLVGAPAWTELSWKSGTKIRIGDCLIQIHKPIGRCPNIDVDQNTGVRRDEIFPEMKRVLGHSLFGVKADVLEGGEIKVGDKWSIEAQ